jgi:hypothetical protein
MIQTPTNQEGIADPSAAPRGCRCSSNNSSGGSGTCIMMRRGSRRPGGGPYKQRASSAAWSQVLPKAPVDSSGGGEPSASMPAVAGSESAQTRLPVPVFASVCSQGPRQRARCFSQSLASTEGVFQVVCARLCLCASEGRRGIEFLWSVRDLRVTLWTAQRFPYSSVRVRLTRRWIGTPGLASRTRI